MSAPSFSCTLCGKCCHNHSLPLTMEEAIRWLEEGGRVGIYCEGIHLESARMDATAMHRQRRGFSVPCGRSSLRVTAILAAMLRGACHNLGADMRCNIYERRPLVCRIYPAEINPFVQLNPAHAVCPPEAWHSADSNAAGYVESLSELAHQSTIADYGEANRKGLVCIDLGINTTGWADEGYVRYMPEPGQLLDALRRAVRADPNTETAHHAWTLYSASLANQQSFGLAVISQPPPDAPYEFAPF